MANETKYTYASQLTLEDSGAQIADAGYDDGVDVSLSSANHYDYPYADFVLYAAFGSAVGAGKCVYLYRQDLNIVSTNDAPDVSANYEQVLVGIFPIPTGATTAAYYPCNNVPLSKECKFWIKNGTGQTLSAGWALYCTPKTFMPGS
jgi:hypothetical protein